jgi:hypothetical protein
LDMFWSRAIFNSVFLAGALALGLFPAITRAGAGNPRGQLIEFSAPKADFAGTNLFKQMMIGEDSSKSPAVDPFQSPRSSIPEDSLNNMMVVPQPKPRMTVMESKRVQALMNKKNWAFVEPEDLIPGVTAEDIFNLKNFSADGEVKQPLSPIERFWEREFVSKDGAANKTKNGGGGLNESGDSLNNYGTKDSTDSLFGDVNRDVFGQSSTDTGLFPSAKGRDDSANAFSLPGRNSFKPDKPDPAQQARMEEFKKLIGVSSPDDSAKSSLANPWGGTPGAGSQGLSADLSGNPFLSPPAVTRSKPTVGLNPSPAPTALTATPATAQKSPSIEEQNRLLLNPTFTMPKRRF